MLIKCPECEREVSDSAPSCPSCGFPLQKQALVEPVPNPASTSHATPIFLVLAGIALLAGLSAPRFLVFMPVMLTLGLGVTSLIRREKGRVAAMGILVLGLAMLFWSSSDSSTSSSNLDAAEIADWSWYADPDFGSSGTVKWNVVVRNVSEKPIDSAKVELTTYDAAGKLLDSTFTFVDAIPPGATRSADSYADYYGSESKAEVNLSSVRFSD